MLSYDTPLWHNNCFRNQHSQAYFSPQLIRAGVLTVGQLLEDDSLMHQIAPTWHAIYQAAVGETASPTSGTDTFFQSRQKSLAPQHAKPWPPLPFWYDWTRHGMANFLSTSSQPDPRQPPDVWVTLSKVGLPATLHDFVHTALWRKIRTGE